MTRIPNINAAWLEGKKKIAGYTAPGPNKDALLAEIAEAERHLEAKEGAVRRAEAAGYRRNRYAGTCDVSAVDVPAGAGFIKQVNGKWRTYCWDAIVADALGLTVEDFA